MESRTGRSGKIRLPDLRANFSSSGRGKETVIKQDEDNNRLVKSSKDLGVTQAAGEGDAVVQYGKHNYLQCCSQITEHYAALSYILRILFSTLQETKEISALVVYGQLGVELFIIDFLDSVDKIYTSYCFCQTSGMMVRWFPCFGQLFYVNKL
jgi:hypothetical protein